MPTCVALGCGNTNRNKKSDVTFHLFPPDTILRQIWAEKVHRPNYIPSKYATLCSEHFAPDDLEQHGVYRRLKPGSIPELFKRRRARQKRNMKIFGTEPRVNNPIAPGIYKEPPRDPSIDHNYCLPNASRIKKKIFDNIAKLDEMKVRLNRKNKKKRRLEKKVRSLKSIILDLRETSLLSDGGCDQLDETASS